jgi:hypothetical protein
LTCHRGAGAAQSRRRHRGAGLALSRRGVGTPRPAHGISQRARLHGLALVATLAVGAAPASATAAQTARLSARFTPERLGAPTSMMVSFRIFSASGIPSPLTGVRLHYPQNLGLAISGLGTAICEPAVLELNGPAGCPRDSTMGSGEAFARFQIGPEVFSESATLGVVAGPEQEGFLGLLVSATGLSPVAARIVMSSVLEPGLITLSVPLVPSLPEGQPVSVIGVDATLGGKLVYTRSVRGRIVRYRPRGISLPRRCPPGGFRFSASFSFLDGTSASAAYSVSCPRRR